MIPEHLIRNLIGRQDCGRRQPNLISGPDASFRFTIQINTTNHHANQPFVYVSKYRCVSAKMVDSVRQPFPRGTPPSHCVLALTASFNFNTKTLIVAIDFCCGPIYGSVLFRLN